MPPKFKALLRAFQDYFFYCEDGVLVIPQEELVKHRKLSYDDIRIGCIYLESKGVLKTHQSLQIIGRIPTDPKKKQALASRRFAWGEIFEGLSRDVFVFSFTSKDDFLKFCGSDQPKTKQLAAVAYDSLNGVITYGEATYAPETLRKNLVAFLWERRKEMNGDKVVREGELWPKDAVAININLIDSPKDLPSVKSKLSEEVKQVNRMFRSKGIPAKILSKKGLQLVVGG